MSIRPIRRWASLPALGFVFALLGPDLAQASTTADDDFAGRRIDTPGRASRLEIVGDLAYVADTSAGLQIIDLSDPAALRIVGHFSTPMAHSVSVVGNIAYVADGDLGLVLVDVRDPTAPALLSAPNPCMSLDVAVSGTIAHVAVYGGLQVFDVANPHAPAYIGDVDWITWSRAVTVVGHYAYYACSRRGVRVFDVTDPTRPLLVREVDTPGVPYDLYAAGDHLFVADGAGGLQVIDIANPSAASIIGSAPTSGFATGVVVSGERAYISNGADGLEVFAIEDRSAPESVTNFTAPGQASGVGVSDNDIIIANGDDGLVVLESRAASNIGPRCDAGGPYTGIAGQRIRFRSENSHDVDGTLQTYDWQFGDGGQSNMPEASHVYAEPGLYFVRLCVSDDDGIVSCCQATVQLSVATPVTIALEAEVRDDRISLRWTVAESDAALVGFAVHRRDQDAAEFALRTRSWIPATAGARATYTFEDTQIDAGARYVYRVEAIEQDGSRSFADRAVEVDRLAVAARSYLHPAAPNPFNPSTTIAFDLPRTAPVRLTVFDAAGRRVRRLVDTTLAPARHRVTWDGRDDHGRAASAGVYVVRLDAGGAMHNRKIALVE